MDVRLPDGTLIKDVPDGMSKADLTAKLAANGYDVSKLGAQSPEPQAAESFPQSLGRQVLNAGAGAMRGAGSIGATLLSPIDWAARKLNDGNPISVGGYDIAGQDRRAGMDQALSGMGADTNSLAFKGSKLFAEMAGTLGVGGGLAKGLSAIPAVASKVPGFISAVESAGMTAPNMLTRMAGGATVGGVSAGLVDPNSAGMGAAIGGALPPALSAGGAVAKWIGGLVKGGKVKTSEDLAKALDLLNPADRQAAIAQLRATPELVPGSQPTVAQALRTPQASTLESIVADSPGGAALKERYLAQNAARNAALESVAPVNPLGRASAVADAGASIEQWARPARDAARARTSSLYNSVPQDEAALYLPDLGPIRDKYFGPGVFTDRASIDKAVQTAEKIGTVELPSVKGAQGAEPSLLQFVKSRGGINRSASSSQEFKGEISDLMQRGIGRVAFKDRGQSIERMAEAAREAGYLQSEDPVQLIEGLLSNPGMTATGGGKSVQRAADAAMGDLPLGERVPVKVTLGQFENLRSSIGQEARAAAMSGNDKAARALGDMKSALDDRINQVVSGDGAIDEVLPLDWADKLSQARASKLAEVKQFGTGPQAGMFKRGAQGQPVKQGGEVAASFWGNRPGLAEDVQSFRRLIDDKPELLGKFRSMVTTEGASTSTGANALSTKYVNWFKDHLPGLRQAFDQNEVMTLGRIASDIERATQAGAAGASRGSPTFRNAANALDVGLLGSPVTKAAAARIPFVGRFAAPAVEGLAGYAARAKAAQLAGLLSNVDEAANALSGFRVSQPAQGLLGDPRLLSLLYRATPSGLAVGP